ncbi:hypothetical protein GCM10027400_16960 [Pseudoxanthomonas daejeonensis]
MQINGQQDQAQGDQGQEADHHREALQEFQIVITHIASYGEWRGRPQLAPIIERDAPASEAGKPCRAGDAGADAGLDAPAVAAGGRAEGAWIGWPGSSGCRKSAVAMQQVCGSGCDFAVSRPCSRWWVQLTVSAGIYGLGPHARPRRDPERAGKSGHGGTLSG